jgi:hypothetical protein
MSALLITSDSLDVFELINIGQPSYNAIECTNYKRKMLR